MLNALVILSTRKVLGQFFDEIKSITEFPCPRNPKEGNSFLGLLGYYHKFIQDFAKISHSLDALRKTNKFKWLTEAEEAFETMKNKLTGDDLLIHPKIDRPFLATCDASNIALGGVVSQLDDQQRERPVSFCSKALKGAEWNYSALD